MKILLQRVTRASVTVDSAEISRVGAGLLVFLGLEQGDNSAIAEKLLQRVLAYRVFPDETGRMNLSVADRAGSVLLVPQFTLAADTAQGRRPGFSCAMPAFEAGRLYAFCLDFLAAQHSPGRVAGGVFGADMQVSLVNDGPVTFILSS